MLRSASRDSTTGTSQDSSPLQDSKVHCPGALPKSRSEEAFGIISRVEGSKMGKNVCEVMQLGICGSR